MQLTDVALSDVAICCDLDHNVFYAAHTDEKRRPTRCARATGTRSASGSPPAAPGKN